MDVVYLLYSAHVPNMSQHLSWRNRWLRSRRRWAISQHSSPWEGPLSKGQVFRKFMGKLWKTHKNSLSHLFPTRKPWFEWILRFLPALGDSEAQDLDCLILELLRDYSKCDEWDHSMPTCRLVLSWRSSSRARGRCPSRHTSSIAEVPPFCRCGTFRWFFCVGTA